MFNWIYAYLNQPRTIGWNHPDWADLSFTMTASLWQIITLLKNTPLATGDLLKQALRSDPKYLPKLQIPNMGPNAFAGTKQKTEIQLLRLGYAPAFYDALVDMFVDNLPAKFSLMAKNPDSPLFAYLAGTQKDKTFPSFDSRYALQCFVRMTAIKRYVEPWDGLKTQKCVVEPNFLGETAEPVQLVEYVLGSHLQQYRSDLAIPLGAICNYMPHSPTAWIGHDPQGGIADLVYNERHLAPDAPHNPNILSRILKDVSCGVTIGNAIDVAELCHALPVDHQQRIAALSKILMSAAYQDRDIDIQSIGPVLVNAYTLLHAHIDPKVLQQAICNSLNTLEGKIDLSAAKGTFLTKQHPLLQRILLALTSSTVSLDTIFSSLSLHCLLASNSGHNIPISKHNGSWHYTLTADHHTLQIPVKLHHPLDIPLEPLPFQLSEYLLNSKARGSLKIRDGQILRDDLAFMEISIESLLPYINNLPPGPLKLRLQMLAIQAGIELPIPELLNALATLQTPDVELKSSLISDLIPCLESSPYVGLIEPLDSLLTLDSTSLPLAKIFANSAYSEVQRLGVTLLKQELRSAPCTIQDIITDNPCITTGLLKSAWKHQQIASSDAWKLLLTLFSSSSRVKYPGGALLDSTLLSFAQQLPTASEAESSSSSSSSSSIPEMRSSLLKDLARGQLKQMEMALEALNIDLLVRSAGQRKAIDLPHSRIDQQHSALKPFLQAVYSGELSPNAIRTALSIATLVVRFYSLIIPGFTFSTEPSESGTLIRITSGSKQTSCALNINAEGIAELVKQPKGAGKKHSLRPIDVLLQSIAMLAQPPRNLSSQQRHIVELIGEPIMSQLVQGAADPSVKGCLQTMVKCLHTASSSSFSHQPAAKSVSFLAWQKAIEQMHHALKEPKANQQTRIKQICSQLSHIDYNATPGKSKGRSLLLTPPLAFFKRVSAADAETALAFLKRLIQDKRIQSNKELTAASIHLFGELIKADLAKAMAGFAETAQLFHYTDAQRQTLLQNCKIAMLDTEDVAIAREAYSLLLKENDCEGAYAALQKTADNSECKELWNDFLLYAVQSRRADLASILVFDHPGQFQQPTGPSSGVTEHFHTLLDPKKLPEALRLLAAYPALSGKCWKKLYDEIKQYADDTCIDNARALLENSPPADLKAHIHCWIALFKRLHDVSPQTLDHFVVTPPSKLFGGIFPSFDSHPEVQMSFFLNLAHTMFLRMTTNKESWNEKRIREVLEMRRLVAPLLARSDAAGTLLETDLTIAAILSQSDKEDLFAEGIEHFNKALATPLAFLNSRSLSSSSSSPSMQRIKFRDDPNETSFDPLINTFLVGVNQQPIERAVKYHDELLACWQHSVSIGLEPEHLITLALILSNHGFRSHLVKACQLLNHLLSSKKDLTKANLRKYVLSAQVFSESLFLFVAQSFEAYGQLIRLDPDGIGNPELTSAIKDLLWNPTLERLASKGEIAGFRAKFFASRLKITKASNSAELLEMMNQYLEFLPAIPSKYMSVGNTCLSNLSSNIACHAATPEGANSYNTLCDQFRFALKHPCYSASPSNKPHTSEPLNVQPLICFAKTMLEMGHRCPEPKSRVIDYWLPIVRQILVDAASFNDVQKDEVRDLLQTFIVTSILLNPSVLLPPVCKSDPNRSLLELAEKNGIYEKDSWFDYTMRLLVKSRLVVMPSIAMRARIVQNTIDILGTNKSPNSPYACAIVLFRARDSFDPKDYFHLYPAFDLLLKVLQEQPWAVNPIDHSILASTIVKTGGLIPPDAPAQIRQQYLTRLSQIVYDAKMAFEHELHQRGKSLHEVSEDPKSLIIATALNSLLLLAITCKADTSHMNHILDELLMAEAPLALALHATQNTAFDLWNTLEMLPMDGTPELERRRARLAGLWIYDLATVSPDNARDRLIQAIRAGWFLQSPDLVPDLGIGPLSEGSSHSASSSS